MRLRYDAIWVGKCKRECRNDFMPSPSHAYWPSAAGQYGKVVGWGRRCRRKILFAVANLLGTRGGLQHESGSEHRHFPRYRRGRGGKPPRLSASPYGVLTKNLPRRGPSGNGVPLGISEASAALSDRRACPIGYAGTQPSMAKGNKLTW